MGGYTCDEGGAGRQAAGDTYEWRTTAATMTLGMLGWAPSMPSMVTLRLPDAASLPYIP